jgi:hypothetical protein
LNTQRIEAWDGLRGELNADARMVISHLRVGFRMINGDLLMITDIALNAINIGNFVWMAQAYLLSIKPLINTLF